MQRLFAVSAAFVDRVWDLLLLAVPALGGALVALVRRRHLRAKADAAERERFRRVLEATARVVQLLLEESIARDEMKSTGRLRPVTAEELAENRGASLARKRDAAEALRSVLGQDDDRPQDMFAPGELEAGE